MFTWEMGNTGTTKKGNSILNFFFDPIVGAKVGQILWPFAATLYAGHWVIWHKQLAGATCTCTFINNSDSFAIPIGGERVTWECLNGC